ncbi:MAG: TRAP transporter small permease subunit [Pseudomonadota bacterium]
MADPRRERAAPASTALDGLETLCAKLIRFCAAGAMAALAYLLGVTALGVAARLAFDLSNGAINLLIPGLFEQATYALAVLVFLAPAASGGGGMIRADLLSNAAPAALQRLGERLWAALALMFAATLATLLSQRAARAFAQGEVSQDLGLPLAPVFGLAAFGCAAWAVIAALGVIAPARATRLSRSRAAIAAPAPSARR